MDVHPAQIYKSWRKIQYPTPSVNGGAQGKLGPSGVELHLPRAEFYPVLCTIQSLCSQNGSTRNPSPPGESILCPVTEIKPQKSWNKTRPFMLEILCYFECYFNLTKKYLLFPKVFSSLHLPLLRLQFYLGEALMVRMEWPGQNIHGSVIPDKLQKNPLKVLSITGHCRDQPGWDYPDATPEGTTATTPDHSKCSGNSL